MSESEYILALKNGKKEYRERVSRGEFPYLPVLDQILEGWEILTEQNMGVVHVPLDFVVGTSTRGRTYSFAANFMPILEERTEFAMKWESLAEAQVNEGIRDPIVAYEFMNRYYVVEGNKRVSVLKHFGAVSIPAVVTRKVPKETEDFATKLYYEYMRFNEITGIFDLEFSKLGNADMLLNAVGAAEKWDDKTKEEFDKFLFYFRKAYEFRGGDRLPITMGDAVAVFLGIYGFEDSCAMSKDDFNDNVLKIWKEFSAISQEESVGLVLDPATVKERRSLLSYFLPRTQSKFKVAFLYPKKPQESAWIYSHELGRIYLEETFADQLETVAVDNVDETNVAQVLEEVIAEGANVVFCVGPQMMDPSLKVAVGHPEVFILNCSLNDPHPNIRTYYGRMYEAKFLSGIIAGALADNDKIAYIADYPIYGMIANINAFAMGVSCVNPRAKVHLAWSTQKDYDRESFLSDNDIHVVSDQDMIKPEDDSRVFGLYMIENGQSKNLAMPIWNWGVFYEKLLQSILAGSYKSEGDEEQKSLNYWWGISAGVIDIICSKNVPSNVRNLVAHMTTDIEEGEIVPFYGLMYDQDGELKNKETQMMDAADIMNMDWLCDNIVGHIPSMDLLIDSAKPVVETKGVEETKITEDN